MKSLYIPAAILVLVFCLSLSSASYVEQHATLCTRSLVRADSLVRQNLWKKAETEIRQSYHHWQQSHDLFHAILEHQELDEAESLYAAVFAACDVQDEPDFHTALAQLQKALQHLPEKQQISLANIF